jgi:hypothetical protein
MASQLVSAKPTRLLRRSYCTEGEGGRYRRQRMYCAKLVLSMQRMEPRDPPDTTTVPYANVQE